MRGSSLPVYHSNNDSYPLKSHHISSPEGLSGIQTRMHDVPLMQRKQQLLRGSEAITPRESRLGVKVTSRRHFRVEDLQSAQCLALSIIIEGMVTVFQPESLKCSSNLEGSLEFVNPQLRSYRNSPALNLLKRFYQRLHFFQFRLKFRGEVGQHMAYK